MARLVVDEGVAVKLLYANVWKVIGLNENHFMENAATIAGFNDTSSKHAHCILMNVELPDKVVHTDFFLMDLTTP